MFHPVIYKYLLIVFVFIFLAPPAQADNKKLTLDLQRANLTDVLRLVTKFLEMNVMISPAINGEVTLHLQNVAPADALKLLLATQGLAKWRIGSVWFIAPQDELIRRKQEETKWQEARNETAPLITRVWQIKYGSAQSIANLLQDEHASLISKRGHIRIDTRTNQICVQDMSEQINKVRRLIRAFDVPVPQILIEARLVSIDNDFERELGVHFAVVTSATEADGIARSAQQVGSYSMAIAKLADSSLLDVKLSALENAGHAELISSPRLFTANQQPAAIEAGEEVPYQEVSESGGTAIAFKKAVLGLKVTPQVLPGHQVLLQLQINQDRPGSRMIQGAPTISTRQITTGVIVKSGQTIVLGGIYESSFDQGQMAIPFISRVPVIGLLFRQQKKRENKRELLIFITPTIMTQAA
ncbi:type IV pilus secretin PilQ [Aquicella lusitana]|uniref:Type IV pilus assembly protein PilQ n=1 Tax=Aquicella lusitana TaxID=254246 RepID=A0A370H3K2_9COXI|nr:secretin N-terminal domain-containing protein [Aquicella lusitana]RDI48643.1 type IV pilus assembly protein PilQ [Aquicella lusitana]VVC73980.1 Type IV pilus biogenesis and competence protein PilQ [Aquicella lusitana]